MTRTARLALITVPAILFFGWASGWLSGSGHGNPWFDALPKPWFMPPGWAFPIVWTTLYILMGVSAAMLIAARARGALMLFALQLALNLAWSPIFFAAHAVGAALAVIVALDGAVIATTVAAWRVRPAAGWLLVPYLAWLTLATPDARIRQHPSLQAVAKLLKPGDYLLAGLQSAVFNFYLAPNPTRWSLDWLPPSAGYTTPEQFAELREDVRRHPTRLVIVSATSRGGADRLVQAFLDDYALALVVPNPVPFNPVPYLDAPLLTYVYALKPSRKATM